MRNFLLITFCFLFSFAIIGQELNCTVTVNSDQLSQGDLPVFKTLERSLNDFVNKTSWSNRKFNDSERINAQMFITITKYESNRFEGNIQIQSSRPVFNTSYETPILNYKDNSFFFQYIEFQPLIFNENVFDSNLVAVIAFYANMILGMDGDSFALEGGADNLRTAQNIAIQGQGTNFKGWGDSSEDRSRFELIDNMLSNRYREYRVAMYNYHRKGLDILGDNNSTGKQVVMGTMKLFEAIKKNDPNSMLTQTFFDAKAEEIVNIFSDGPKVDIVKLKETLNNIAPQFRNSWNKIKF